MIRITLIITLISYINIYNNIAQHLKSGPNCYFEHEKKTILGLKHV